MKAETVQGDGGDDTTVFGMRVQWDDSEDGNFLGKTPNVPDKHVTCDLEEAIPIQVDTQTWRPRFERANEFEPDEKYGNDHRFSILGIRGRLHPVRIHRFFASKEERTIAASTTGVNFESGREMWRRVTIDAVPNTIRGWASIEHPDLQTDEAFGLDNGVGIVALFMSKTTGSGSHGLGNFLYSEWTPVYRVLYLRKVEIPEFSDCYERVGVGRLFGYEVKREFEASTRKKVWLV